MNHSPARSSHHAPSLPLMLGQVAELMGACDYDAAIAMLSGAPDWVAGDAVASHTLALLLLRADRAGDAVVWFETALSRRPTHVPAITGLAMAQHMAGDLQKAALRYEEALRADPNDAVTWYHQGVVQDELGLKRDALESLDQAISLKGDYGLAFARRARILEALGNVPAAIEAAVRCCQLLPNECSSWTLVGDLLQKAGHLDQAIAAYDRGLSLAPSDFPCLCNKAHALKEAGRSAEALKYARAALEIDPGHRGARLLCGYAELDLDNAEAARAHFLAIATTGMAHHYPAASKPVRFRVLMLFSPFGGNTPYEDLIRNVAYDVDVLMILPDHRHDDPAGLVANADIVVNLVSEPDSGRDAILAAAQFVAAQNKPVVNTPKAILDTDRQTIAQRLAGIGGAVMPKTIHADAMHIRRQLSDGGTYAFPLIVRLSGTHGGEMMERAADADALLKFLDEAGDTPLYLTDYVDYASRDGHFRKYRFIFAGPEILPYHLAIGDGWKVHHASTRMREVEWMRREEEAFLNDPKRVFGNKGMAVLEDVRRRIGLDYFGIDCSLDSAGNVVIFEVNASMLIHLRNEGFDYKTPHVMRIKAAFERMLEERVKKARPGGN